MAAKNRVSKMTRSEVMRRVKSRDTAPERRAAALLSELDIDFRRDAAELPGRPDLVIDSVDPPLAVFVHGCWWHGHSCPRGARTPTTNRPYWIAKITRNRRRDRRVARQLRSLGYSVWTIWECRLKKSGLPGRLLNRLPKTPK